MMTHPKQEPALALPLHVGDPTLDTFATLLDALAELLDVPGVHCLRPEAPLTRRDVDALVAILGAPGLNYLPHGLIEVTGTVHGSRITVTCREVPADRPAGGVA